MSGKGTFGKTIWKVAKRATRSGLGKWIQKRKDTSDPSERKLES